MLIFLAPALYFVDQNYQMFFNLAYDVKPDIVIHLEREAHWLKVFFLFGSLGTMGVCLYLGRRLLNDFVAPLEHIEDHLKALGNGQWTTNPPTAPRGQTDQQLFLTYAEFIHSFREMTKKDLHLLESLTINASDRTALDHWKKLVASHRQRLALPPPSLSDSSASSSEVVPLRRVS